MLICRTNNEQGDTKMALIIPSKVPLKVLVKKLPQAETGDDIVNLFMAYIDHGSTSTRNLSDEVVQEALNRLTLIECKRILDELTYDNPLYEMIYEHHRQLYLVHTRRIVKSIRWEIQRYNPRDEYGLLIESS